MQFLIISEFQHFFLTLAIAIFFFWRYRDWRIIPFCFLVGFFIDFDHWFDQFACFGFDFSLTKFFNFDYVYECQKVIVPLHGWEFLIPLWLIGKLINRKFKIKGLEWAIPLAYLGHLFLDQFSGTCHPLAYFFTHRLLNNFSLESFNGF